MSRDDDDWSDLQAAWRQDRPDPDDAFADRLRDQVRRERARSRWEAIAEIAVSVFCAVVFLWWAAGAEGGGRMLFTALALGTGATLLLSIVLRRSLWRAHGATVAAYRQVLRRRARMGLLFARLGYVGGPVGVAAGLLIAQAVDTRSISNAPGLNDVIGVVALAALAAGWVWALREAGRHKRALAALETDAE
ncbi:MAG: hypothetical protein KJS97_06140 [Alphaproteobacteria bacterium]|nr:hypothetical protein [Alphaproteobacteria bacterium]